MVEFVNFDYKCSCGWLNKFKKKKWYDLWYYILINRVYSLLYVWDEIYKSFYKCIWNKKNESRDFVELIVVLNKL